MTIRVGPTRKVDAPPAAKNRYEPAEDLGQGGMGKVTRGVDRFLGRPVAFKRSLDGDPQMLEALLHEAEIAARLDHPGIVTIHDVAYDEHDDPFVVMRYIDGQPLSEVVGGADLAARLRLLPRVVAAIEAVAYAHSQGVVHRDLKPDNILVGDRGDTVVIDWGLARDLRAAHDPFEGATVGTPGFMPPEKEPADPRLDVYALGVTLFFILAGKLPGTASLGAVERGVPADLVTIVEKACARDRQARYPSAAELAADLQRFIGGQLVAAHRYGVGQRLVRWVKRHRLAVAIAVLATAATTTLGVVALRNIVASRAQAEHERTLARAAEARAADRADQLLVDRAHALLGEDPTRAIALLDLRSRPAFDAATWAIAVEASARGVPKVWRPHRAYVAHVLALDGGVVVSAAQDGTVVLSDAASAHPVASYPHPIWSLAAIPNGFVIATEDAIERFDRAGTRVARWPTAAAFNLYTHGDWLVAYAASAHGWYRRIDDTEVHDLPVASTVAIDPHDRWLALGNDAGIVVIELATGRSRRLLGDLAHVVTWSSDGTHLLAATAHAKVEWDATDWSIRARWTENSPMAAYVATTPMAVDNRGCVRSLRVDMIARCTTGFTGIATVLDGQIYLAHDRAIDVLGPGDSYQLLGSPNEISRVTSDPTNTFVVAGTHHGELVRWDLGQRGSAGIVDEISGVNVGPDNAILAGIDGVLTRIARDGRRTPLAKFTDPPLAGRQVFVVGTREVWFDLAPPSSAYVRTGDTFEEIAEGVVAIATRGDHELLLHMADDTGLLVDLDAHKATRLQHAAKLASIGSAPDGAISVAWGDGHVWWETARHVEHTVDVRCKPTVARPFGELVDIACGNTLYAMAADHSLHVLATFDEAIDNWRRSGDRFVVSTVQAAIWRISGSQKTQLVASKEPRYYSLAPDRFAIIDRMGEIFVYDIASGERAWIGHLALPKALSLSEDGRAAVAAGHDVLLRWYDPTPTTASDWPAWRRALTSATLPDPKATLQWP